jgi:hypothetical protein
MKIAQQRHRRLLAGRQRSGGEVERQAPIADEGQVIAAEDDRPQRQEDSILCGAIERVKPRPRRRLRTS